MFIPVWPDTFAYTLIWQWQVKFFIPPGLCIINYSFTPICFLPYIFFALVYLYLLCLLVNVIVLFIYSVVNKIISTVKFTSLLMITLLLIKVLDSSTIFLCFLNLNLIFVHLIKSISYYCASMYLISSLNTFIFFL